MKKAQLPSRYQSGVSMIGVLITILISVIGLFSAMQLQLTAVSNTHSAYFRSQAAVLTNGLVDQMRANPTGAIAGNYDIAVQASTASTYTLRATPKNNQAGDGFLELSNSFTKSWDADNSGTIGAGESTWSKY